MFCRKTKQIQIERRKYQKHIFITEIFCRNPTQKLERGNFGMIFYCRHILQKTKKNGTWKDENFRAIFFVPV
jgi:hypothetical protein